MQEIWKDIKGYEGLYQISNLGNVKSLERISYNKYGKISNRITDRILKPESNKGKYLQVSLYNKGKRKVYYIHRLVAIHFLENKENKKEINHIDRNTHNNNLKNLEWVTPKENMRHLDENYDFNFGRKSIDMYDLDYNFIKRYKSISDAGRDNGARLDKKGKPHSGNILRSLKTDGRLTAYGHRFKYVKENDLCND